MLNKNNRLKTNFEYNITRKYGKKIEDELCNLFYLEPRNYSGLTKIGFVIPVKLLKKAAHRNRLKRLFREAVRKNFDIIPRENLWIVIHPKKESIDKTYEDISTSVNKILQKIPIS